MPEIFDKEEDGVFIIMVFFIKDIGKVIRNMEKEDKFMRGDILRENGLTI